MPATEHDDRRDARLAVVDEHIRLENRHDLDGIMATFGTAARYDDEAWDGRYTGRDGVRAYYQELLRAMPDLQIEVLRRYMTEAAVVVEVIIRGHHRGPWRGLPATGRALHFPLCGIYTFDDDNRLAGERIYYDRATVLRQLGILHEPDSVAGRLGVVLMHPLTMARLIGRAMLRAGRKQDSA